MDLSQNTNGCGEDVAPYALGALPPEEARRFQRHLVDCDLCRADLATLSPIVDALPDTAEPIDPPPALRKRIMAVVDEEAAQRRASERQRAPSRRPEWLRPMPALAAACVLLFAGVGLGVALTGEDVTTIKPDQAGASAELRMADDHGTLVAEDMENPPAGRVYQVWVVRGKKGKPEPTKALFTANRNGEAEVEIRGDMDDVTKVLVSDEPTGGSTAPTTVPAMSFSI